MIQIVRILGESVDVETLSENPPGMIISNGIREEAVPATKELLEAVIRLRVEQINSQKQPQPAQPAIQAPRNPTPGSPTFQPSGEPEEAAPGEQRHFEDEGTGAESI